MRIDTRFDIGDRVTIDKGDVTAIVVSFELRPGMVHRYEVSWWHNGDIKFSMVDGFRLSAPVPAAKMGV